MSRCLSFLVRPLTAVFVLASLVLATPAARAATATGTDDWASWRPTATTAVTYGALYASVVVVIQGTRLAIAALVPAGWLIPTQIFGIPMVMVPMMAHLVPSVRQSAPGWVETILGPAPVEPEYKGSTASR